MQSRAATLQLTYAGTDISKDIAPYVTSFSYTDNAHGQADDLQLGLEDRAGLWQGDWLPGKGDTVSASILCSAWDDPEAKPIALPCGTFEIDEVTLATGAQSGDGVTLKAVSSLVQNSIRKEVKTRAWEFGTLMQVFQDIACQQGFTLVWQADNASFTRLDQRGEADLTFMQRICDDYGLNLKLSDGAIIVFSGAQYDAKAASRAIVRGETGLSSVNLRTKTADIYTSCEVSYHDPKTKTVKSYTYKDPGAPVSGRVLRVNQVVEDIAMAERKAKGMLRKKNQREVEGDLSLMGEPRLLADMNVQLRGFRKFDGVYAVEQATHAHSRTNGYTTAVKIRKVLSW